MLEKEKRNNLVQKLRCHIINKMSFINKQMMKLVSQEGSQH